MEQKKWYTSKTLLLAIAQAIVAVIVTIVGEFPEADIVSGLLAFKSVLDIGIRLVTSSEIKLQ